MIETETRLKRLEHIVEQFRIAGDGLMGGFSPTILKLNKNYTSEERVAELERRVKTFTLAGTKGVEVSGSLAKGFIVSKAVSPSAPGEGTSPPPLVGACCDMDGVCTITSSTDCVGTYQGDGTVCDPNPCSPPCIDITYRFRTGEAEKCGYGAPFGGFQDENCDGTLTNPFSRSRLFKTKTFTCCEPGASEGPGTWTNTVAPGTSVYRNSFDDVFDVTIPCDPEGSAEGLIPPPVPPDDVSTHCLGSGEIHLTDEDTTFDLYSRLRTALDSAVWQDWSIPGCAPVPDDGGVSTAHSLRFYSTFTDPDYLEIQLEDSQYQFTFPALVVSATLAWEVWFYPAGGGMPVITSLNETEGIGATDSSIFDLSPPTDPGDSYVFNARWE